MKAVWIPLILNALFIIACDDTDDSMNTSGAENLECSTNDDCKDVDLPNISIWYSTCSGMVLQTPTGTGLPICGDEGICVLDFAIVERDCSVEGLICVPTLQENTQGDDCIDPSQITSTVNEIERSINVLF